MSNIYHQINTRVRSDLVKALKQRAKNNHRTMQAEHEIILIDALLDTKTKEQQQCNQQ